MIQKSGGILFYRFRNRKPEVLLVHPGGPFWAKKDLGAWSIPKGELNGDEDPLDAARREVREETGMSVRGELIALTPVRTSNGKLIYAWAVATTAEPGVLQSNTFSLEWPPGSGKKQDFPEVDKIAWFSMAAARKKINKAQIPLLSELASRLRGR
jgi:predicted NUDIX family NTP pyrophosphohydrolase